MLDQVVAGTRTQGYLLWRGRRALTVPRTLSRQNRFKSAARLMTARGWPVVVRQTGGAVAPLSPGLLNVAMAFTDGGMHPPSIENTYRAFCAPLIAALASMGISASCGPVAGSFCDGNFNLVVDGRKVAGTAMRWRRRNGHAGTAVLAHAVVLCAEDLPALISATNSFQTRCGLTAQLKVDSHVALSVLCPHLNSATLYQTAARELTDTIEGFLADRPHP